MALAGAAFLDTSILLGGLIELRPSAEAAQAIWNAIAAKRFARPHTAWHCCLEFYSVATRLPEEFRLSPEDGHRLVEEEILTRLEVHSLPAATRRALLRAAAAERIAGGRIYDAHIAEVARATGVDILVTENRRHFASLLRHGIRILTAAELVSEAGLGKKTR